MIFSKRSALHIVVGAVCGSILLFSLPYTTKAVESGPDWINGQITIDSVSDYVRTDDTQATAEANITQEKITAKTNIGSKLFPSLVDQTMMAYPTGAGYFAWTNALPLGEQRWQGLDSWHTQTDWFYPNPTTAGLLVTTNVRSSPRETYYVSDWRDMYKEFRVDSYGNVLRSPVDSFTYTTYPRLQRADGSSIRVPSTDGVSYSKNGLWAYMQTADGEAKLSLPSMTYAIIDPPQNRMYSLFTAISNSGRFVVTAGHDYGLLLYDTSNCPDSQHCTRRDATSYIKSELAKIVPDKTVSTVEFFGTKFQSESVIELYAMITYTDRTSKYIQFHLSVDPTEQATRYLALGDSFSSGEGVGDYYEATNFYAASNDYNFCHQSRVAYSELLNTWLKPDFYDSVACSGAVMKDVVYSAREDSYLNSADSQAKNPENGSTLIQRIKQSNLPGYIPQLSLVDKNMPNIVTISISGNDIGFGDIITSCVTNEQCYQSRDDRERLADLISSKIPVLAVTFNTIKRNMSGMNPKLYVLGYPQMFAERSCGQFMGIEEQAFANHLVDYLNATIKLAAAQAGAYYVDVTGAFGGSVTQEDHRLCGNASPAANGFFLDTHNTPQGMPFVATLFRQLVSSYHPNALGHQLLASTIRQQTGGFNSDTPSPVTTAGRPSADMYKNLVGDADDANQELEDVSESITNDVVVEKGQSISVSYFVGNDTGGLPVESATITVVAQSTPVVLGTLTVQADNTAKGTFAIPASLEPGMHTIHLLYNDISGQAHDVYQYIFVIANTTDFDGDGIPNSQESCLIGGTMGTDRDRNGIDDACDPEITEQQVGVPTSHPDMSSRSAGSPAIVQHSTPQTSTSNEFAERADVDLRLPNEVLNLSGLDAKLPEHSAQNQVKEQAPTQWPLWVTIAFGTIIVITVGMILYLNKRKRLLK